MGLHQKTVLMRVSKNRLVDGVTAFLLPVRRLEAKRRSGTTIDVSNKVPAFVVKKTLAVSDQELQIADLRRIDGRVIHLGHTSVIERVPDAAGS